VLRFVRGVMKWKGGMMNYLREALELEPVRVAAGLVLTVVAALTAGGIMIPAWAAALAGMVAAELARRKAVPVLRTAEAVNEAFSKGAVEGAQAVLSHVAFREEADGET